MPERRGETTLPRPPGPLVWLHGASVGEISAVLPLIERIRARDLNVLVTSGTVTSADIAEKRLPPDVIHQFAPLDVPQFAARFLDHWKPDLGLFVESDLWPNIIMAASERNVPLILVNGRLSERSFDRWRLAPRTIGALLRRFDLCLAQSSDDGARYTGLGAPRIATSGNLKLDVPAPPADEDKLAALSEAIGGRPVIAATSTHPGEEAVVIDAHRRLKHSFPGLLTLVAPRHPERGQGIAEIAKVSGLTAVLRSRDQLPTPIDRHLRCRHGRRAWPGLSAGADRVRRRFAGQPRRAKSDRGDQARRRRAARAACLRISPKSMRRSTPPAARSR